MALTSCARSPRRDLVGAVVFPLVGHAGEPFLQEQVGQAIHLRCRAEAADSDLGGGLARHQSQDDLAPKAAHGDAGPLALVPNDRPLAWGEPLPSRHDPSTNRHEEFVSLAERYAM